MLVLRFRNFSISLPPRYSPGQVLGQAEADVLNGQMLSSLWKLLAGWESRGELDLGSVQGLSDLKERTAAAAESFKFQAKKSTLQRDSRVKSKGLELAEQSLLAEGCVPSEAQIEARAQTPEIQLAAAKALEDLQRIAKISLAGLFVSRGPDPDPEKDSN